MARGTPTTITLPSGASQTFGTRAAARAYRKQHPGSTTSEYGQRIMRGLAAGKTRSEARGHGPTTRQYIRWNWSLALRQVRPGDIPIRGVAHQDYTPPADEDDVIPLATIMYVPVLLAQCARETGDSHGVVVMTVDADYHMGPPAPGKRGQSPRMHFPGQQPDDPGEPAERGSIERAAISLRVGASTVRGFVADLKRHSTARLDRQIGRKTQRDFTDVLSGWWPLDVVSGRAYMVSFRRPIDSDAGMEDA